MFQLVRLNKIKIAIDIINIYYAFLLNNLSVNVLNNFLQCFRPTIKILGKLTENVDNVAHN